MYRFKDVQGQKFGRLTVIKRDGVGKSRYIIWLCRCECGAETRRKSSALNDKIRCLHCQLRCGNENPKWRGFGEIPGSYWWRVKQGAQTRNLPLTVTIEQVSQLFIDQGKKCALTGAPLVFGKARKSTTQSTETTASLDRIDSSKGYVEGNIQFVHKIVQRMKMDLPEQEFMKWCRLIVEHGG